MKFDSNGRLIKQGNNKPLREIFMEKVINDANVIAKYLEIELPKVIKLKNGYGGLYSRGRNEMAIGFGDGEYSKTSRKVVMHEMLHHKGLSHGHNRMGHSFMSNSNNDILSLVMVRKIFKEEIINV
jgi:hypothetical protein